MKTLIQNIGLVLVLVLGGVALPATGFAQGNPQQLEVSPTALKQLSRDEVRRLSAQTVAAIGKQYPGAIYEEYVRVPSQAKSSRAVRKVQRVDYDRLMFLLLQEEQAQPTQAPAKPMEN